VERPPLLKKGDTIGLVAPARKIVINEIAEAISTIKKHGFKVKYSDELFAEWHQFAGSDKRRAANFQSMLDDDEIRAIISVRGGYGSIRIIDQIDFSRFKKKPKWIIGFSDITVFHSHINRNFNTETLHASMLLSFAENTEESLTRIFEILSGGSPEYKIASHQLNRKGISKGILCGGNLSVLYSLMGSRSFPEMSGKILFIEDLDEYLYHIDRMMTGLKRAGIFKNLKGLVVGGMTDMNDNEVPFGKTAEEIISEAVLEYEFPVCYGFPAGHINNNLPLIMGANVSLKVSNQVKLTF
jgi:muramoyltetrapeptide carboxypeptidase